MSDTIGKSTSDNMQKYMNYKEQFKRLKKAFAYKFYMEAIFIEYAIIEDRAESILRYEGNEIKPKNEKEFITITRKLNKISAIARENNSLPFRYFSDGTIADILNWIKRRNSLIHALLKKELTTDEVEAFAREGEALAKTLCNKSNNYKRAIERREAKK